MPLKFESLKAFLGKKKLAVISGALVLGLAVAAYWYFPLLVGVAYIRYHQLVYNARELLDLNWGDECAIAHPGQAPDLFIKVKPIHPLFAEYEFKLRMGSAAAAVERWLPMQSGGRSERELFWYPNEPAFGPCIRVHGGAYDCLVSLSQRKTFMLVGYEGRVFAGEITQSDPGWGAVGGTPPYYVAIGSHDAVDITESMVAKEPGLRFGKLNIRYSLVEFIPEGKSTSL